MQDIQLHFSETEQPNLKLKTRPEQLLGSLLLDIALSTETQGLNLQIDFKN